MICFLDSSALVKRYIDEAGTEQVRLLMSADHRIVVSWLAYPEVLSAVTRRSIGKLPDSEMQRFREQLSEDFSRFLILDVAGQAIEAVDKIIASHGLRGADSIHLATALWFARSVDEPVLFVASDRELIAAAKSELLSALDPSVA